MKNTKQAKPSRPSHQSSPVCARRKLAGFADKSTSVAPTQTQTRNASGTEIGTRYRYIDDTPLVPFNEKGTGSLVVGSGSSSSATGASSTSAAGAKTRSRPSNEYVLYSYGEPIAMTADGNASYFGTDILGSVRNVTDKYGSVQANYNYDAFGSPYLSNLDNDIGFGYCGKIYDNGTGLYNYGFRDYYPVSARFTTIDPIRDGANWFSYVVNDPVNYTDPFGLTSTDVKNYTYQGERNGRRYYTANTGGTMWGLANDTGTALSDVQGYDGDPHKMPIGTELSIPAKPSTPTPPSQPAPSAPAPEAPTPEAPAPTVPTPSVPSAPPVSTGNLSSPDRGHSSGKFYTASNGKKVVVGISTSNSLVGILFGEHAFIMCIDEQNPKKSIMLDASGEYGGGRSADIIDGYQIEISVENYLKYWNTNEKLTTFELILSEADVKNIKKAIESIEGRSWLTCAYKASEVLNENYSSEIKKCSSPKGLLKELQDYKSKNPNGIIVKNYDFKTNKEIFDE